MIALLLRARGPGIKIPIGGTRVKIERTVRRYNHIIDFYIDGALFRNGCNECIGLVFVKKFMHFVIYARAFLFVELDSSHFEEMVDFRVAVEAMIQADGRYLAGMKSIEKIRIEIKPPCESASVEFALIYFIEKGRPLPAS